MSTNASVAIELPNGRYRSVYVHFDGGPNDLGATLRAHYHTEELASALIDLGNLSEVNERLTPSGPHSWADPERGVCVAYGRDRGESNQQTREGESLDDVLDDVSWQYLFYDSNWHVRRAGDPWGKEHFKLLSIYANS